MKRNPYWVALRDGFLGVWREYWLPLRLLVRLIRAALRKLRGR